MGGILSQCNIWTVPFHSASLREMEQSRFYLAIPPREMEQSRFYLAIIFPPFHSEPLNICILYPGMWFKSIVIPIIITVSASASSLHNVPLITNGYHFSESHWNCEQSSRVLSVCNYTVHFALMQQIEKRIGVTHLYVSRLSWSAKLGYFACYIVIQFLSLWKTLPSPLHQITAGQWHGSSPPICVLLVITSCSTNWLPGINANQGLTRSMILKPLNSLITPLCPVIWLSAPIISRILHTRSMSEQQTKPVLGIMSMLIMMTS